MQFKRGPSLASCLNCSLLGRIPFFLSLFIYQLRCVNSKLFRGISIIWKKIGKLFYWIAVKNAIDECLNIIIIIQCLGIRSPWIRPRSGYLFPPFFSWLALQQRACSSPRLAWQANDQRFLVCLESICLPHSTDVFLQPHCPITARTH